MLLLLAVLASCGRAHAQEARDDEAAARNLPELPVPDEAPPVEFELDDELLSFVYDGKDAKLGAELDGYMSQDGTFTLDYGLLVNRKLGVGTRFSYLGEYTEALASTVYAPARSVRVQLTAGELRGYGDCADDPACDTNRRAQNSYLVGFRKYFGQGRLLSAFSLTGYSVADDSRGTTAPGSAGTVDAGEHMRGRLHGQVLNLRLRPAPHSVLEVRRGRATLGYYSQDDGWNRRHLAFSAVDFSRRFGNCLELHARHSTSTAMERTEFALAGQRWSLSVARSASADGAALALNLAYTLPLRAAHSPPRDCSAPSAPATPFAPLIEAATRRPARLPQTPLTATDSAEIVERMAGW